MKLEIITNDFEKKFEPQTFEECLILIETALTYHFNPRPTKQQIEDTLISVNDQLVKPVVNTKNNQVIGFVKD